MCSEASNARHLSQAHFTIHSAHTPALRKPHLESRRAPPPPPVLLLWPATVNSFIVNLSR